MMYTLYRSAIGVNASFEISSRISSILLFDAASISTTSTDVPLVIAEQFWHSLHGSTDFFPLAKRFFSQFMAFATIRAVEVFPVPFGPVKRNAWGSDEEERIFKS